MPSKAEKWLKRSGWRVDPDSRNPEDVADVLEGLVGRENIPAFGEWFVNEGRVTHYRAPNCLKTYVRSGIKFKAMQELFDQARELHKDRRRLFGK